jgi:hypothetical protein
MLRNPEFSSSISQEKFNNVKQELKNNGKNYDDISVYMNILPFNEFKHNLNRYFTKETLYNLGIPTNYYDKFDTFTTKEGPYTPIYNYDASYRRRKNNGGKLNKFATGGPIEEEGGYPIESINKREWAYEMYDPSGGLDFSAVAGRNYDGGARGEEDQYWRAYLGLRNDIPKMKPSSKTEWDDQIEAQKAKEGLLPSEFYGTTNAMDLMIQAMADTTTTGQIVRNYEAFKRLNPNLAPKKNIEAVYNSGKDMMDNPGKWTQVGETKENSQLDIDDRMIDNEQFPLGMLAAFGAKWIPEENTIHIHDTYDFPTFKRKIARIPDRPREMKIRGKVKYNPKNRAKIFNSENFNLIFPK